MIFQHFTAGTAANIYPLKAKRVHITINAALTGTIILSDETGTSGSPIVATITNPTVGLAFEYWGLNTGVCITPSTTCDITVSVETY